MLTQTHERWLEVEPLGNVTLVRLLPSQILEEGMIQSLGEQLFSLVKQEGCRKLVLDFRAVEKMGSAMLGKVRKLYDLVHAAGGQLAFCKIHPALEPGLDILRLPRSLIHTEEQEAIEAVQRARA
jgi:anti-sigma B factor antagonist